MVLLFIITVIGLLMFGAYQIRKVDRVLSGDDSVAYETQNSGTPPKIYGILFGNGKSRIKKTNRLKFRHRI